MCGTSVCPKDSLMDGPPEIDLVTTELSIPDNIKQWLGWMEREHRPKGGSWMMTTLLWGRETEGMTWTGKKAWDRVRIIWAKKSSE